MQLQKNILARFLSVGWIGRFMPAYLLVALVCLGRNAHAGHAAIRIPETEKTTIPFQYVNGFIVLELRFQQLLPLRFILDTGAENSILFKKEYAELLGLEYVKTIKLVGSDLSREMRAMVTQGVLLQLQGMPPTRQNLIVLDEDFLQVEEIVGMKIDGLIGCAFFSGKALKIDFKKQELTVFTARGLKNEKFKNYTPLTIDIIQRKPYIQASVSVQPGRPVPVHLLLDTGAALSCLIHANTDTLLQPGDNLIPGSLGKGLGGDIEGFTGLLRQLRFGEFAYENMITSFQNLASSPIARDKIVRNGILGTLLLERFTLVIDWQKNTLWLKPEKKYNRPFDFDKSGMVVFAHGPALNRFTVRHVIQGSPASEAGMQVGDEIKKVGIWPVRWFNLAQVNKKFSGREGKKMRLTYERNGIRNKATFILRNLLASD